MDDVSQDIEISWLKDGIFWKRGFVLLVDCRQYPVIEI